MPLDKKLIHRKITLIDRDMKSLKQISLIPLNKFLHDHIFEAVAERNLERVAGRMIDINYHILAQAENESPVDYYNSFILLGNKNYLPVNLSRSLAKAAGLRNILAHEYDEIDEKKIYQAVLRCLKEVPLYVNHIIRFLDKGSKQKKLL